MDANELRLEISQEALFIKGLSLELTELRYDLECCPANDELYDKLMRVKKLSGELFDIIEDMQSIKRMSEI